MSDKEKTELAASMDAYADNQNLDVQFRLGLKHGASMIRHSRSVSECNVEKILAHIKERGLFEDKVSQQHPEHSELRCYHAGAANKCLELQEWIEQLPAVKG